ncbi:sulfurtransferase-like selenium metabolism protein YedF [Sediminispirochaeta bajacaliforniensis]|uniref:sulfurtransferase-like selenium metabolism protein YedF n=1 Tax=Sediminispirochaeta bajacaliforniensis TaxID=148 RepID=UPI00035EA010|nr:sulfurtransferase-like selenium metabolism protein YedF [Sediminispirochaeta bajacaliforniensis]
MSEEKKHVVDARGLPCPQPVIRTKKALGEGNFDTLEVIVDNSAAVTNVTRYAEHAGYKVIGTEGQEGAFTISIAGGAEVSQESEAAAFDQAIASCPVTQSGGTAGKTVFISKDTVGEGDRELGRLLMSAFLFALTELDQMPKRLVFMNSGVKLTIESAKELGDLKKLEAAGIEILACGTCLDYYGLKDKLAVGMVSNMYDIATALLEGDTVTV